LFLKEKTMIWW